MGEPEARGGVLAEMKKTVIFEFPDDFKFPKHFGEKNTARVEEIHLKTTGELFSRLEIPESYCNHCPFNVSEDGEAGCFLTGDVEFESRGSYKQCPFYGGAETVNYDDC